MTLRRLEEFCPKGMQIRSPGGLSFDLDSICAMESYNDDRREAKLIIHLPSSCITIRFYDNVNGAPPDVYGLERNITEAQRRGRDSAPATV